MRPSKSWFRQLIAIRHQTTCLGVAEVGYCNLQRAPLFSRTFIGAYGISFPFNSVSGVHWIGIGDWNHRPFQLISSSSISVDSLFLLAWKSASANAWCWLRITPFFRRLCAGTRKYEKCQFFREKSRKNIKTVPILANFSFFASFLREKYEKCQIPAKNCQN